MTDLYWRQALWSQFGASIEMLENAVVACPDEVWRRGETPRAFWYVTYHALFFLDLYTHGSLEGFAPPAPFTLDELDPAGVYPERVYEREELLEYLAACRGRCRAAIASLTADRAAERCEFAWGSTTYGELLLDNMRHVQHHAAQLHWVLRGATDSAPAWVGRASDPLACE